MALRQYLCEFCNSLSQEHDMLNNVNETDNTSGQPSETEVGTNNNENAGQRVENSDDNYLTFETNAEIGNTPQTSTSDSNSAFWKVYKELDELYRSFEYTRSCTDFSVTPESSISAPDKNREMDARFNEPLMEDAGAGQGPSTVYHQSVVPGEEKRKPKGEKSYVCNYCGKTFGRKTLLNIHARIHTGEKPYKCDICEKAFTQKNNLVDHLRTHSGQKPHKCRICGKGFGKKSNYNTHLKTHTDEKPYSCDFCDKIFYSRSSRNRHAKTHKAQKSYECGICQKSFSSNECRNRHIRQKHQ